MRTHGHTHTIFSSFLYCTLYEIEVNDEFSLVIQLQLYFMYIVNILWQGRHVLTMAMVTYAVREGERERERALKAVNLDCIN